MESSKLTRLKPSIRRARVLQLLLEDRSEAEIANQLNVSYRIVLRDVAWINKTLYDSKDCLEWTKLMNMDFIEDSLFRQTLKLLYKLDETGDLKASLNFRLKLLEKFL